MNLRIDPLSSDLLVPVSQHSHKWVWARAIPQDETAAEPTDKPRAGFTLIEIMIVAALVGLLAALAIPNFVRARVSSQRNVCINNLRQIDAAKQEWAFDSRVPVTATPTAADIQPYLGRGLSGNLPTCPADAAQRFATSYLINSLQLLPTCRIVPSSHALAANAGSANRTGGDGGGGDGGGTSDGGSGGGL